VAAPAEYPGVVVGVDYVGLACVIDLAQQGVPVVLNNDNTLSTGSRAICFAKPTLEISLGWAAASACSIRA
jgi:3-(3-hydroxy-phenyl)propionate hydroxylase